MRVSVIGTGYVGLVTGTCLAEHGHRVICVDQVAEKIETLARGEVPIYEPGLKELIDRNVATRRLNFSRDAAAAVAASEIIFIAVGTPPGRDGDADLSNVKEAALTIGKAMRGYRVVVNKSTVPVGTVDLVAGILAEQTPYPFDVVSNPEFLREGAAVEDCLHPDRIVIGVRSERAAAMMRELYRTFDSPLVITHPRTAEMIKYAANAFLAVKISFINEIAGLCERLGADVQQVAHGIGLDRRIGSAFLKAGIGYGGSCFPKDTRALTHMAGRVDYRLPIVEAAMEVNRRQRNALIERLNIALGGMEGKVIGLLGLAFKPNTDDVREAPALDLIQLVTDRGGRVRAFDPKALENARRAYASRLDFPSDEGGVMWCSTVEEVAEEADALILATEWPEFATLDWKELYRKMRRPYLFDGRNFLDPYEMRRIGFTYVGVGRGISDIPTDDGEASGLPPVLAGEVGDEEVGMPIARHVPDKRDGN